MIWRWFWREWRSPSLLIVWLALTLAVACVLALGSISDRMDKGLSQQSREFIAGDRVLRSAHPITEAWLQDAQSQGLKVSRQLSFMTMTFAGETPQLAAVKATDLAYPLYGALQTEPAGLKPEPGTVLVAPRLLALLNVKVGDNLDVGDTTLKIAGVIVQEPDSGFNPFQTAPRVIMNLDDVPKTGAIQPGSRLTYRYMFAGSPQAVAQEVQGGADAMLSHGIPQAHWFRGATAKYDPSAIAQIRAMGFQVAGYSINGDSGASLPAAAVEKQYLSAKDGDVLISHINQPTHSSGEGVVKGITELKARGVQFVRLQDFADQGDDGTTVQASR